MTWTVTIPTDDGPLVVQGENLQEIRDAAQAQGYPVDETNEDGHTHWPRLGLPDGAIATRD